MVFVSVYFALLGALAVAVTVPRVLDYQFRQRALRAAGWIA
jgi:hypothetical protein